MSVFNVGRFRNELVDGGARPNQFSVWLIYPGYVAAGAAAGSRGEFLINTAELPGQSIGTTPVYYRGREIKMAGDRVFAPFAFTVLNDTEFLIRNALEQWMNGMENRLDKTGAVDPAEYYGTAIVRQLDRNGTELIRYEMRGVFPIDISPVQLDFQANDQISQFQCTLQYQDFLIL